ncbi:MAG: carboxypeptidase-like regulatory domain-containing protein [Pyrinomonadaceae bacterium]
MDRNNLPTRCFITASLIFCLFVTAFAQQRQTRQTQRPAAAIGFTGAYTQDFQSFTGISNTNQDLTTRTMYEVAGFANGGGITGWYVYGTSSDVRWGLNKGNNTTGGFYSIYDDQASRSRAFGSLASSANFGYFGIVLRNDTANSIVSVSVTYDAVIARNPSSSGPPNDYPVKWRVSTVPPDTTSGATGDGTFNDLAGTWHAPGEFEEEPDVLSFTTPSSGIGSPGSSAQINPLFVIGTKTQQLQGIGWDPGQYLYIRWFDKNDASDDALAGIDNFQITTAVTAADATVSGQVVDTFGSGVSGAVVTLTSASGERRSERTSPFGYFTFKGVQAGETYVLTVASKRYSFTPRSLNVGDSIDDLRIVADSTR